jgi:hypothetical protein
MPRSRSTPFPSTRGERAGVALLALGPPLLQWGLLWAKSLHVGPDQVWLGFTQRDQPFYLAAARALFERGNGIFAANPYDLRPDAPWLYSHLVTVAMGWIWRLTGLAPQHIDLLMRLTLGPLMLWLGVAVMGHWVRRRPLAWPLAAGVVWGSGLAWLFGLLKAVQVVAVAPEAPTQGWPVLYLWHLLWRESLAGHGGWGTSLSRQVDSAAECLHHVLSFAALLALARRRWAWAVLWMALVCWSHPFTGLLIGLITLCTLGAECVWGRHAPWRPLVAACAVMALFLLYNGVWLPRDPAHREIAQRIRDFSSSLATGMILPAYGLWVVLPFLCLLRRRRVGRLLASPSARLLVIWIAVGALLLFNDRWLALLGQRAVSPLHFSRGYMMLALAIAGGRGLIAAARRWHWSAHRLGLTALVLALLSIPDTLETLTWPPSQSVVLTMPREDWDLLQCLNRWRPGRRLVCMSRHRADWLGFWLPVYTPHVGLTGHLFNTPQGDERRELAEEFQRGDIGWGPLAARGIEALVIPRTEADLWQRRLDDWTTTPALECGRWEVWEVSRPRAAPPTR